MTEQGRTVLTVGALTLCVIASAIAGVYARHESRKQFTELQQLIAERDELEVEWGRLQIEQSTWSAHSRVESMARTRMHMRNPKPEETVVIR